MKRKLAAPSSTSLSVLRSRGRGTQCTSGLLAAREPSDNRDMLHVCLPPPLLAPWVDSGVVVHLDAGAGWSRFPAVPHAILTMQLQQTANDSFTKVLCSPIVFHTLSTAPACFAHAAGVTAIGLVVRPAASAALLRQAGRAVINQVLAWHHLAGPTKSRASSPACPRRAATAPAWRR